MASSHLHGGVVAERRRIIERPMRTVCAWCAGHDRPAAVLVDVPLDDRGLSHGICAPCRSTLLSGSGSSRAGLQTRQRTGAAGSFRI